MGGNLPCARFPLSCYPPEVESDKVSLREFHVKSSGGTAVRSALRFPHEYLQQVIQELLPHLRRRNTLMISD